MAIARHISDGINTWDLPSGEAFKIPLGTSLSFILAGGSFNISGVRIADLKAAIAAGRPIVFYYSGFGTDSGEILITHLGDTGGGGLGLSVGTIVINNGVLKIFECVFSGNATNVTGVNLIDITPTSNILTLNDLSDVSTPAPQNGDVLTFDRSNGVWVAEQPGGGGGSGDQLPVIIDIGRIVHQNGAPIQTIADVPQNSYTVPFDRQITFSYRAYESGVYAHYWTGIPDAYKIGMLDSGGTVRGNAEDLHWIVQDMINNQQLPLTQDIEYRLMMYKVVNGQTWLIEIPLWLSTATTATKIDFYLDSSGFNVRQVQYIGSDT